MACRHNSDTYSIRIIRIDLTDLVKTYAGDSGKKSSRSYVKRYLPSCKQRLLLDRPGRHCIRLLCRLVFSQTFAQPNIPDQQWHFNVYFDYLRRDDGFSRPGDNRNKNLAGNQDKAGEVVKNRIDSAASVEPRAHSS